MFTLEQPATRNTRRHSIGLLIGWLFSAVAVTAVYLWVMQPGLRTWPGTVTHGNPAQRTVALTFDDGPHPLWAPLLADTLERHGARGAFFLVGIEAQRYPEITARLARAGHQVGNHSLTHPYPNLTVLPPKRIATEIRVGQSVLARITGQPVHDFRPPGGGVNDAVLAQLKSNNLRMAWWSANLGDWSSPRPEVTARYLHDTLRPGLIVLMHERENSVAALELFLAGERQGTYRYVTLEEMTSKNP